VTGRRVTALMLGLLLVTLAGCSTVEPVHRTIRMLPARQATRRPRADAATNAVLLENRKPGTPHWRLGQLGASHEIEGWADRTSVVMGARVGLHVSTTARRYRVRAFRIGWYGGTLARQVWVSPNLIGVRRPVGVAQGPTHTVRTNWPVSLTVSTAGWPVGSYLFRLDGSTGAQRYVPLQVRAPSAAGRIVVVSADTTWQAYNNYGGYSLYSGPDGAFADRATAVSFDRPYGIGTGQGASEYMENMRPLVTLVEKLGLSADYVSDVDLDADPQLLSGARAVIFTGHDEYWSMAMRNAMLASRTRGTNLAFLGANTGYRHIRFATQPTGPDRLEICYKVPNQDPLYGRDDALVTGQWRYPPDPRPESVLTGVSYQSNPVRADMIVVDPRSWLLAGTNSRNGTQLPSLVAPEYDRLDLSFPTPRPIEVITHSPLLVRGRADFADSAYYTTSSGSGVFATGTIAWINGMQGASGRVAERFTTTVTTNLLLAFAAGPAGFSHPAIDNVRGIYPHGTASAASAEQ
jgi:hypothetical protein